MTEARHTYTIRLPEQVAARIEAQATGFGIAPTTLIQSLISGQFENGATQRGGLDPAALAKLGEKLDALRKTASCSDRRNPNIAASSSSKGSRPARPSSTRSTRI
jgi:hypothetical protein